MYVFKDKDCLGDIISENSMVLFQFGSSLCLPCISIKEKIEKKARQWKDIRCVYIPFDHFKKIAAEEGVFTVPTIFFYIDGKLTIRESGYFSLENVFEKIERYRELLK